jgi:hypothetical protein
VLIFGSVYYGMACVCLYLVMSGYISLTLHVILTLFFTSGVWTHQAFLNFIQKGDADIEELTSHPVFLYFGLLAALTSAYGNRKKNIEWMSFSTLKTWTDFDTHFSAEVESYLLYWILYLVYNPNCEFSTYNRYMSCIDPVMNPMLIQCEQLVVASREDWFSVENCLLLQAALQHLSCLPMARPPAAEDVQMPTSSKGVSLVRQKVYHCLVDLSQVCLCLLIFFYVCLCLLIFVYISL